MLRTRWVFTVSLMATTYSAAAVSTAVNYNLVKQGNQVCKQISGQAPTDCYDSLEDKATVGTAAPEATEIIEEIDALNKLKTQGGFAAENPRQMEDNQLNYLSGAFFLSPAHREFAQRYFSRISVRHMAIDKKHLENAEGRLIVPFYSSVYWKGKGLLQGTIHFEGLVNMPLPGGTPPPQTSTEWNAWLTNATKLAAFSDSDTAEHWGFAIERSMREFQFAKIYGDSQTDQHTADFIKDIVAPLMLAEIYHVPLIKAERKALEQWRAVGQP